MSVASSFDKVSFDKEKSRFLVDEESRARIKHMNLIYTTQENVLISEARDLSKKVDDILSTVSTLRYTEQEHRALLEEVASTRNFIESALAAPTFAPVDFRQIYGKNGKAKSGHQRGEFRKNASRSDEIRKETRVFKNVMFENILLGVPQALDDAKYKRILKDQPKFDPAIQQRLINDFENAKKTLRDQRHSLNVEENDIEIPSLDVIFQTPKNTWADSIRGGVSKIGQSAVNIAVASTLSSAVGPVAASIITPMVVKGLNLVAQVATSAVARALHGKDVEITKQGKPILTEPQKVEVETEATRSILTNAKDTVGHTVAYGIASTLVSTFLMGTLDSAALVDIASGVLEKGVFSTLSDALQNVSTQPIVHSHISQYIASKLGVSTVGNKLAQTLKKYLDKNTRLGRSVFTEKQKKTISNMIRQHPEWLEATWSDLVAEISKDAADVASVYVVNNIATSTIEKTAQAYSSAQNGGLNQVIQGLYKTVAESTKSILHNLAQMPLSQAVEQAVKSGYQALYSQTGPITNQPQATIRDPFQTDIDAPRYTSSISGFSLPVALSVNTFQVGPEIASIELYNLPISGGAGDLAKEIVNILNPMNIISDFGNLFSRLYNGL